jgi:hypothetical protein
MALDTDRTRSAKTRSGRSYLQQANINCELASRATRNR